MPPQEYGKTGPRSMEKICHSSPPIAVGKGLRKDSNFTCVCSELTDFIRKPSGKQCPNITKVLGNKFPICPQCGKV
jgi:hypothetical protein